MVQAKNMVQALIKALFNQALTLFNGLLTSTLFNQGAPCMVYLPTFTIHLSQNVGKYTIHSVHL